MDKIYRLVQEYREKTILGKSIELVPLKECFFEDVIRMRNQKDSTYFLNQQHDLTMEMQRKWYAEYLSRNNDLYWLVCNKQGDVVGTISIYEIDQEKCNRGRAIIDEKRRMEKPYAFEAFILSTKFAFDILGVNTIVNANKIDNAVMNSISHTIGYDVLKEVEIRGVKHYYYELNKETFRASRWNR